MVRVHVGAQTRPTYILHMNGRYVFEKEKEERLDIFVSSVCHCSRTQAQKMIADGRVLVNKKLPKKSGDRLKRGVLVEVKKESEVSSAPAEEMISISTGSVPKIQMVHVAPEYIVVHKPAGLLVHPTDAAESDTVVSQVLLQFPDIAGVGDNDTRPGIVHRLDKEASGLLVVARTAKMYKALKQQFQKRTVEKEYEVLVHGTIKSDHGEIDFPIGRAEGGMMAARPKADVSTLRGVSHAQPGKEARSEFFVEHRYARYTLLRILLHTGRTHQIRVHMRAFGNPVVGDTLYFNKKLNRKRDEVLGRLFLHAKRLCFADLNKERQCFSDPLPVELQNFLNAL